MIAQCASMRQLIIPPKSINLLPALAEISFKARCDVHCCAQSFGGHGSIVNVEDDALFRGSLNATKKEEAVTYVDKVGPKKNAQREELAA